MKKTICIFSALYDPHIGGVENYTKELAAKLLESGFRVIVVTNNHAKLPAIESPMNGLIIYRLPCYSFFNDRLPLPKRNAEFRELMQELANMKIDHIYINTRFYPHSLIGARFARKKGLCPVVIEHGSDYLTFGRAALDPIVRVYEHFMTHKLKRFHPLFYAVSQRSSVWLQTFGISSSGEFHNAIDVERYLESDSRRDFRKENSLSRNAHIVSFVGRLTPEKGIEQFVESAKLLEKRGDILFLIAGEGPLLSSLEKSAPPNVLFLGRLSRPDIVALLNDSDVLCLPSRSEGFATVLLEAAACSTALVVTDVGGARELIPDENHGIILEDRDPETIANALLFFFDDIEHMQSCALKTKELVETAYNWDRTAEKLIYAFEEQNIRPA